MTASDTLLTLGEPLGQREDSPPPAGWVGDAAPAGGEFELRRFSLISLIVLFLVSGVTTVLGAIVSSDLTTRVRVELVITGAVATSIGALVAACRRARWDRGALLVMVLPALGTYGIGNYVAPDPYIGDIYLFVIAIWVGLAQRRGVNLALAPLYALTYWLPLWLAPHGPTLSGSVPYVVIVALATGETVAWLTSRLLSASERLRGQDRHRFAALVEEGSGATLVINRGGTISYASPSIDSLLGYRVEDLQGRRSADVFDEYLDRASSTRADAALHAAMESPLAHGSFVANLRRADGVWRDVEVKIRNLLSDDVVRGLLVDIWDVTDRVQAQTKLLASEESFRLLFQLSPLPTLVVDPITLQCLRANDAACTHYGYTRHAFISMRLLDLLPVGLDAVLSVADAPAGGYLRPGSWQHQTRDRRLIDVEIAVNRIRFAGVDACTVMAVDVTEQRLLESQLRHQALHDPLTGLANRALLQDRLGRALAVSRRQGTSVAVLYCDLDGFKVVNDSLGRGVGDQVLQAMAGRLGDLIRPGDTLARFGADEFVIVVEVISESRSAQALANQIIEVVARPLLLEDHRVELSVSIGIAFETEAMDVVELCHCADAAKYEAKSAGKNCYRVFEVAMRSQRLRRLELSRDLGVSLDHEQFTLQYQPHVALPSGELRGFEALVRWSHPTLGMIQPAEFVPLAEESGLIVPLGRWLLLAACTRAAGWPDTSGTPLTVAVNLSAVQLRSTSIVDDVRVALMRSGLDPARLVLEITESVLMADSDASIRLIKKLKSLGVGLAIDDFGTGYSSLSYLRQFDFDILKIDKSFVDGLLDRSEQGSVFIRTIVALGHSLDMKIVTEGIETNEQYRELARLGSDYGQGYLMSRPLDPEAALAFINRPAANYGAETTGVRLSYSRVE